MRALVQRVNEASVTIAGEEVARIGAGLLVFFGAGAADTELDEAESQALVGRLWEKIWKLRIFADAEGKTNLSLGDVEGEVLIVPQFTLYASCRKGNRPSFTNAAPPAVGEALFEAFCARAAQDASNLGRGVFGADMEVGLVNDGPFTIWLDSDELFNTSWR